MASSSFLYLEQLLQLVSLIRHLKIDTMKKTLRQLFIAIALIAFCASCSRGITMFEAANGKAKCGRYIR